MDYRQSGYVPEAVVNYLALLGWSPGDDREIMSLDEMCDAFRVERIGKTPARFDPQKLAWMNGEVSCRFWWLLWPWPSTW